MKESQLGSHDYSGTCEPTSSLDTFSVGIFQWVATKDGKGLKKSPVIVRVKGSTSKAAAVYDTARELCRRLDNGETLDQKTVTVK